MWATQQFVNLFSSTLSEISIKRTPSDPAFVDPATLVVDGINSEELIELILRLQVRRLDHSLLIFVDGSQNFQDQLDHYGIDDSSVRCPQASLPVIIVRLMVRCALIFFLLCIAMPGNVALMPLYGICRWKEYNMQKKNVVPPRLVKNMDEIAQYKLAYAVLLTPLLVIFMAAAAHFVGALLWYQAFFLTPVIMWISVRALEELIANARICLLLCNLFCVRDKVRCCRWAGSQMPINLL